MKILHIAAHVGGGIGSAYVGLGGCGQQQSILLLERPVDRNSLEKVRESGFRIVLGVGKKEIEKELQDADVVLFDWTHHPALTKFLRFFPEIPIRSILWCHVSGNYFPHISAGFVKKFDQSIFATPYSLELPQIKGLGEAYLRRHCAVVYGLNDLRRFAKISKTPHSGYRVGYVGTMGFCKLHPDFIGFCGEVGLPDVQFLMVGAPSAKGELLAAAARKGIDGQLHFFGQLPDVAQALGQMDAFGYLLNPQHFGATENALLEAMAAGLPVIALDQCVERGIVRHEETGLLIHSPEEYGGAVRFLHDHPQQARQLGEAARAEVLERYDLQANRRRFLDACARAVTGDKHIHRFDDFFAGEPADWFLKGVGADRECFEEGRPQDAGRIFREATKGSPGHYQMYFPEDRRLNDWSHLDGRMGVNSDESKN